MVGTMKRDVVHIFSWDSCSNGRFYTSEWSTLQRQRDGQVLKEKRSADGIEQEAKGLINQM